MTATLPVPLKLGLHKHQPQMEPMVLDEKRIPPRRQQPSTLPSHHSGYITRQVGGELNLEHCTDLEIRPPGPGEVVVKLLYSGICRTVRLPAAFHQRIGYTMKLNLSVEGRLLRPR